MIHICYLSKGIEIEAFLTLKISMPVNCELSLEKLPILMHNTFSQLAVK